ncbi:MAG: zf-HC2 domain-containing protein [Bacillota bacterium]
MRCEDCRELLWVYAKDELAPEIKPDVKAHLGSCRECAKELMYVRKMITIVNELPIEELPPQYHTSLVKKLKREAKKLPKDVKKPKKEKAVAIKQKEEETVVAAVAPQKTMHEEESDRPFESSKVKRRIHEEESDKIEQETAQRRRLHDDEIEEFGGFENIEGIEGLEGFEGLKEIDAMLERFDDVKMEGTRSPIKTTESEKSTTPSTTPSKSAAPSTYTPRSKVQGKAKTIKEKEKKKKKKVLLSKRGMGVVAAAFLLLVAGGGYQLVNSLGGLPSLNFGKPSSVSYSGISASDMAEVTTDRPVADIPVDEFGNAVPLDDAVMARGNFEDATDMNESNESELLTGAPAPRGAIPEGDMAEEDPLAMAEDASQSETTGAETTQEAMTVSNNPILEEEATVDSETEETSPEAESVDQNIVIKVRNMNNAIQALLDATKQFSGSSVDESNSGIVIVSLSPSDVDALVAELASIGTVTNISVLNPAMNEKQTANIGVVFYM